MNDSTQNRGGIMNDLVLAWKLLRDPQSPLALKAIPLLALLYLFAPEGLFFWPMATPIDDVAIFYAALKGIAKMAPPHLVAKYTNDPSLNYVDGEYEIVEDGEDSAEKNLGDDMVIDPDKHDWN